MTSAATMRILDWAKKHLLSPEVVSRLLQAKGVEIKSFFSVATLEQFESIREAAVAEQERIDKKVHPRKSPASSNSSSSKTTESQSNKEIGGGRKLKVTLKRPAHEEAPPPQHAETKKAVETNSKEPTQVSPIATSQPKDTKSEHLEQTAAVPQEKPQTSSQPNSLATKQDPAPTPSVPSASQQQPHQPASTPVNPPMKAGGPPLHPGAAQPPTFPPKRPTAPMKATVSGPTPEMLARIQKHREQQAQARRSNASRGPGGAGYTGSFGRSPAGGNRGNNSSPHRGPGRPGQGSPSSGGAPFGNSIMADAMAGAGFRSQKSTPGGRHSGKKGGKNKSRNKDTHQEQTKDQTEIVRQSVNRVMASLSKNPVKKTYRKEAGPEGETTQRQVLKTSDFITVGELAGLMEQMPAKVIAKCMEMGLMVTINHRLDFETIQVLADEFGFDVELMEEYVEENLSQGETDAPEDQRPRSPIVTVMGHVDHGKTSLLDYVRKANVVAGESGGITQHIGAYEVSTPNGKVTFLDTPGHEAFTAMRARGSQVTDVIVLVVASDSAVMPQTLEVIELAKSAKVPLVVAITKCDLPTSNPDKIRAQLAERGVEVEQWGGQTSCVEVSARTGAGIDKLLETLTLETEVLELKANPTANARGTVIESKLDPGKGAMATILIQNGTLRVGDIFVCGNSSGRVRAMFDERGRSRREAGPSIPAVVIGFDETPQAGDDLVVFEDEKTAREIASKRRMAAHERELRARKHMSLEQVYDRKQSGEFSELNLIVKADVDGSAEAIAASLERLTNKEVKINIIRKAVGAIKEDDIMLASSADAVIIAFHLMPSIAMREMAEREGIEIRTYRIIYEIIEDIQGVVEGMLKPILRDEVVGEAEIREIFKIPKVGIIAGCMVKEGLVDRESRVHVFRDGVELGTTQVQSLKRHKDDAKEVKAGLECGIGLKGYENLQAGDSLVFFKEVKVARTLADVEADAAKAVAAKLDAKKK